MRTSMIGLLVLTFLIAFSLQASAKCCTKTGTKGSCSCCCDGEPSCGGDGESCACSCLSRTGEVSLDIEGMTGQQILKDAQLKAVLKKVLDPSTLKKLGQTTTPVHLQVDRGSRPQVESMFQKELRMSPQPTLKKPALKSGISTTVPSPIPEQQSTPAKE